MPRIPEGVSSTRVPPVNIMSVSAFNASFHLSLSCPFRADLDVIFALKALISWPLLGWPYVVFVRLILYDLRIGIGAVSVLAKGKDKGETLTSKLLSSLGGNDNISGILVTIEERKSFLLLK